MTLKEKVHILEQLKHLRGEVDMLSQRIAELELIAQGGSGRITGMPRGWYGSGKTEDFALKIIELCELLDSRRFKCMEMLGAIYTFIDDIPDSLLRQIFTYRYIDDKTWQQIAFFIGEHDEQVPRRLHNRYLSDEKNGFSLKFDENDEKKGA